MAPVSHGRGDSRFLVYMAWTDGCPPRIFLPDRNVTGTGNSVESIKFWNMEIVNVEKKTFDDLLDRMERFMDSIETIYGNGKAKSMSGWLDNQDVCLMLNICPRTLQTLRDSGALPYSRINHKIFYKEEDILRFVSVSENRKFRTKK